MSLLANAINTETTNFSNAFSGLVQYFTNSATWIAFSTHLIKVLLIYIAGILAKKLMVRAVEHMFTARKRNPLKFDQKRALTIGKLAKNVVNYAVNFIVILMILSQLGIQMGPLLAGAGVVGLAIGFGAQSLVKDVISGFFIIFEDQFGVGDVIQTGSFKGTVEEIGLRVTRIKNWTGELHILPNGSIGQVTNFSVNNSIGVVDVSIAYEEDIDKAMKVIKQKAMEVYRSNPDNNMVNEPDVVGVQTLGASEVVIRTIFECKPMGHFAVGRILNKEIKQGLDAAGIEIPYPRLVTYQRAEKVES